jgi:tellurite resistance protein TehA-like permease
MTEVPASELHLRIHTARNESPLASLHPAYFAVVMATGIVSIACHLLGFARLASSLFGLNLLLYPSLWVLTLARVFTHRDRIVADLLHHGRSVGFFTTVAATNVFGSQCLLIGSSPRAAFALWILGIALWVLLTYTIFTIITIKAEKPSLAEGISGAWLLGVVAAQSVSVLGAQLSPSFGEHAPHALLFCLAMWLGGGMLYLWIISLIFYRYTFFVMSPSDLAPPYWINMGAAAISALAGTLLVGAAPHSPVLAELLPFVRGFTLWWWATATWWIPMLVILALWRHAYRKFPLRYDPLYWGVVFPLGMYTVSTLRLATAVDAPYLAAISRVFVYIALLAWSTVAIAMTRHFVRLARSAAALEPPS